MKGKTIQRSGLIKALPISIFCSLFLSSSCLERTSKIALKAVEVTATRIGNTKADDCNGVTVVE